MKVRALAALALLLASATAAQTPVDRSRWFDKAATTSDDPRRVPVPKGWLEPKGAILIINARLFDGTGAAARPAAILIEGSHITRIATSASGIALPAGTVTIDGGGKTVMPGLIDMHTHLTYGEGLPVAEPFGELSQAAAALRGANRMRIFAESGVTSARDTGSHGLSIFVLKQWQSEGRLPGPRIFAAGQLITGTGGHGSEGFGGHTSPEVPGAVVHEAVGAEGFRQAVREQFKRGADFIKLASHFSPDEVQAAVQEAHELGLRVTVDSETIYTQMAVEAGVDCVEHPLPRTDAVVKMMAAKGICSIITLVPYQIINAAGGYNFSTSRRFTLTDAGDFAMARKLQAAGVKIGIGTDLVVDWIDYMPDAYVQELRNYKTLGHSDAEALVAATRTNAELLAMGDRLGTIEPGKLADIILVDGKPDQTVEDLVKVDTVIVNGRIVVMDGAARLPRHVQSKPTYPPPAK